MRARARPQPSLTGVKRRDAGQASTLSNGTIPGEDIMDQRRLAHALLGGALLALMGCTTPNRGPMMGAAGMPRADDRRMCEVEHGMMAGKTPEERRAALEQHIRSMHGRVSPDMVEHHQRMIESYCRPAPAP